MTYSIEAGDWENATGEGLPRGAANVVVVKETDLRKAIEPVSSWFDTDGEEGEPIPLIEVVSETAKMLVQEREECLRLRKALQDIIKHHEIMGGQLSRFSGIRIIAQKALGNDVEP